MLKSYLKKISEISNRGDAREESYYRCLEDLVRNFAGSLGKKKIDVTTLPKKTEAGNPDFRIWDGKQHITGYIEAKEPAVENLDRIEDSEQLKRYLHTFPNLILTNFLEFRLYRNGEMTDKVLIGRPVILKKLKTTPPVEKEPELLKLLEKFFSFSIPRVYDARGLAIELAKRTRFLKDEVIAQELREEEKTGKGFIRGFYKAFKDYLISGLTEDEFSDLYAQTITYGLFAARTRSENGFNRKLAYDNIPQTIGILRDVFQFVSLGSLPRQMEWIIDDISEVLSSADINRILHQYYHEGKGKDPVVHFYETFLSEYDPKTREMRGVYYTPEPVVSYIVRSLRGILKERFNRPDGFADRNVTVLDPAAGTLTFLAETARLAVDEFVSKYGEGGKENFIRDHILKNFYAFELMMAPYAIGHLKMSFLLEELGHRLRGDDRVKLYLTNTLEMEELAQTELPGMASLSEESHLAGKVKKEQPILAILGNPPYSGISTNKGDWITEQIENYKYVDGTHFGEKKHWLQDDYVKFIRFAQWKIDQAGEGVLGFITNHGYLDNPTFRGMRQSLMNTFDEIHILDLHGNSLKKEKCPDGGKDENVFDIQQGVAIGIFIKSPLPPGEGKGEGKTKKPPLPPEILGYCRQLREDSTDAEKKLWCFLRDRRLGGAKFRRQHPLGRFILDFYCHEKGLAVELDGGGHADEEKAASDAERTKILEAEGIRVLRFWNNDVLRNTESVLEEIWGALATLSGDARPAPRSTPHPALSRRERGKVYHADLWGLRREKYDWLIENDISTTEWKAINPKSEFYFFVPRDEAALEIYERYPKITDIFPVNVTGIVTARDHFIIDFDKNKLKNRIMTFRNKTLPDEVVKESLKLKENYMWRVSKARKELVGVDNWEEYFKKILYRPFDIREIFFHPSVVWRTRREVMRHMMQENLGLCVGRAGQVVGIDKLWNIVFVSENIVEFNLFYRGGEVLFPLYLYPETEKKDLLSLAKGDEKTANISPGIMEALTTAYKKQPSPEKIFHYIYAVLYSNIYRTKYAEFLKTDFPRVPFTKNHDVFIKLGEKGKELADLHLLKSPLLDTPIARFQGRGDDRVEKLRFEERERRVHINAGQYFEGIEKASWEYMIGGYRVLEKWLKDRKGRALTTDDIRRYCRVATAVEKTIGIQKEIDGIYPQIESGTIRIISARRSRKEGVDLYEGP